MDYYKIGQRIRKMRKACGLTQEKLAELVKISNTHMSHIETGNTKLSLPLLVKIAETLSVQIDELLYDSPQTNTTTLRQEISELLNTCSNEELYVIIDIIKAMKVSLDKHYNSSNTN